MNVSEAAFLFSVDRLFDLYAPRVFFWTFTFEKVHDDWFYPQAWARFSRVLAVHLYRGHLHGLRVIETHEEHGLHYHALLNQRVWAPEVRRIGERYGIGRVHVVEATRESGRYLAKYLSKQHGNFSCQMRRWGGIGGFPVCRKKDVQVDSPFHRAMQEAVAKKGGALSWEETQRIFRKMRGEKPYEAVKPYKMFNEKTDAVPF